MGALFATPKPTPPVFGLKGRVGRGRANLFQDVKASKGALARAGYYPEVFAREADGHVDSRMRSAILGFQSDKGLRIDGWMGPGGQTERELERTNPAQGPGAKSQGNVRERNRPVADQRRGRGGRYPRWRE